MKVTGASPKGSSMSLPPPPYNAKTGKSLGLQTPDNYGRPQIKKDDNGNEEQLFTISERLGISGNPFDGVMVITSTPQPRKVKPNLKIKKKRRKK